MCCFCKALSTCVKKRKLFHVFEHVIALGVFTLLVFLFSYADEEL